MNSKKNSIQYWLLFLISLILFPGTHIYSEESLFPKDNEIPGWNSSGPVREFNRNGLYGHINGGSELFLEFGFQILKLQQYRDKSNKEKITIETYRMDCPEAALGIYLMKCGDESSVAEIDSNLRHTGDQHQIMIMKSNYFVIVNNFGGNPSLLPDMVKFANYTLAKIPAIKPAADLFSLLPEKNKVPGSEMLFRGPFSLESIFTFGEGDVLLLNDKIFGVTAKYRLKNSTDDLTDSQEFYNRLIIRYPDEEYSKKAFNYIKTHLDSYIQIIEKKKDSLIFKDYRQKFGIISLDGNKISIQINLPAISENSFP